MSEVIGVDACRDGWIAASRDGSGTIRCRRIRQLADLFVGPARPRIVAVDTPIGLLDQGSRDCDVEARRLLGTRRSSVFPAPIRPILTARSHADASRIRRLVEGKGVSIQTWAIVPKIAEVDRLLHADMKRRDIVREVHPEVSFLFLNGGRPIHSSKKKSAGHRERAALLQTWFGQAFLIYIWV